GGLLAALSYHYLFYGNALGAMSAGLIFYFYFRRRDSKKNALPLERASKEISTSVNPQSYKSPYKDGPFIVFNLLCAVYCICFYQLLSTLPLYYKEELQLADSGIGMILAFNGLVVFLLEMILVQLAERRWQGLQIIVLGTLLLGL